LDTNDFLSNEGNYKMGIVAQADTIRHVLFEHNNSDLLVETKIRQDTLNSPDKNDWLKAEAEIKVTRGFSYSYLSSELVTRTAVKHNRVRLFSPISQAGEMNKYAYYIRMPTIKENSILRLYIYSSSDFEGVVEKIKISSFRSCLKTIQHNSYGR